MINRFLLWITLNKPKGASLMVDNVVTLTLGSRPRQGLAKVWAKSEARESHFMFLKVGECERMNLHISK